MPPVDVKMSVGGVDLTGVIAWAQRTLSERNGLRLSVHYEDTNAIVVGDPGGKGGSLWIEGKQTNEEMIIRVAYALAYRRFIEKVAEAEALTPEEFRTLLTTLNRAGELNRLFAHGRSPGRDEYVELVDCLDQVVKKTPKWAALISVAAELADNAKNTEKALAYFKMEYDLLESEDPTLNKSVRLATLRNKIAIPERETAAKISEVAARVTAAPANVPALSDLGTPSRQLLDLLGVDSLEMGSNPLIAVLSPTPPSGILSAEQLEMVGQNDSQSTSADPEFQEYASTVVQAVQLVAPKARFAFPISLLGARTFGISDSELLVAIGQLVEAKPKVLLVTIGPLKGDVFERVFADAASKGILVVVAAGNEGIVPIPFSGHSILDQLMVVSATDRAGLAAIFSQRDAKTFWAPGTEIPVSLNPSPSGGSTRLELRSGTTYSAALAAGVASRVLDKADLEPKDLIELLRSTTTVKAKNPDGTDGPPVLNLKQAIAHLPGQHSGH